MAAPVLSGLEGSTHVPGFYKHFKNAILNLFSLLFKVMLCPLNNLQHGIVKQSCKSKGKHEQSNGGMYLIICSILLLMPVLLMDNPPKTHSIIIDPLGILSEKPRLYLFGFGYATVFTQILKDGRDLVFKPAFKITRQRKNSLSSAKILLLLS